VAEDNLKTQQETPQLTQWRLKQVSSAGLMSSRAQQPKYPCIAAQFTAGIEEAKNRLGVCWSVSGALEAQLGARKPIPEAPVEVAVGVPAETLRRRPDVRRAERQLPPRPHESVWQLPTCIRHFLCPVRSVSKRSRLTIFSIPPIVPGASQVVSRGRFSKARHPREH
jgi:hypothetical protein